jgi:gliding motility-associated-like protein
MIKNVLLFFLALLSVHGLHAQEQQIWLHPNEGQWNSRILYKVDLQHGSMYIERDRFTYDFHNLSEVYGHAHGDEKHEAHEHDVKRHVVQSIFVNSSWTGGSEATGESEFYRNYYLKSDSAQWKSKVKSYQSVRLFDFYEGIDLLIEAKSNELKYSFEVDPGADADLIEIQHLGADEIKFSENHGKIITPLGVIEEGNLDVWTESSEGNYKSVNAKFWSEGNTVKFDLDDYDKSQRLIIDPTLTFSSFVGSTIDSWGFTAAPDNNGNLFAGGIAFGTGYPTSTGAYNSTFNGGEGFFGIDVVITKFNATGTALMYSTYLGGSGNETPNSIVVDTQDELYILGVTSSTDFPVSSGAHQTTFSGGTTTTQNSLQFTGSDIFVSRLNANGTALLSSTYYGGSDNDGLNLGTLNYNYGDQFRGEIIVDSGGDVYFASSTESSDIAIVNGFDATLGGDQDGVAVKMNGNLTNLIWSTYVGGSNDDAAFALQTSSTGEVYVTGGTSSTNFPISSGFSSNYSGGSSDGYILRLDGSNGSNLGGTFIGTSAYDQSYFVQLDITDEVYVFGQSSGNIPISPGIYNNPNSGQFIQKYSNDLSTRSWSTVIGGGNGTIEISPTAFLVSNCGEIYYAGWGGQTNQTSQASSSTSNGLPVSANAFQTNTNGNNFYVAVLGANAAQLNYATFMGGTTSSANHVDGGTSRFDKDGSIYHAVCGGCGGNATGFTTTPGVWSETNPSSNCNIAAWKFDLGSIQSALSSPDPFVCIPDSVFFSNNSQNGNDYFWDFGDGNTSTAFQPSHFYNTPGSYTVTLVVSDTNACFTPDTSSLQIVIADFNGAVVQPSTPICPGDSFQFQASGGQFYSWTPAQFLDDPNISNPTAIIDSTTTFTAVISDTCGVDTISVTLEVYGANVSSSPDQFICLGDTVALWASGGVDYLWNNSPGIISSITSDTLIVAPQVTTDYEVELITPEGCTLVETVTVEVFQGVPIPSVADSANVCLGESINIIASGGLTYLWYPDLDISSTTSPTVSISTDQDRWYYIDFINPCGTRTDSVFIDVIEIEALAGNDTIVCRGEPVYLFASGGVEYSWKPAASVADPFSAVTSAQPQLETTYTVFVTDEFGCKDSADVRIDHFPEPYVQAGPDYYGFPGDEIEFTANGSDDVGTYFWSPSSYLSCVNCQTTIAQPPASVTYQVTFTDGNGCEATDDATVFYESLIYVPNTFTPDGDNFNDLFYVVGGNIEEFHLLIFNRWGETLFESYDINATWDGTYNGTVCKDGTYVWKIRYTGIEGEKKEITGHVNILR